MRRRLKILVDTDRLRDLRSAKAWSQEELAAIAGLSVRTVQRIEKDGVASLDSRRALAAAFDMPPTELAAEADAPASFVDHPAPSAGLTAILVAAVAAAFIVFMRALDLDSGPVWLAPTLLVASILCLAVLGLAFWLVGTTYYRLTPEGVSVRWGPSVRQYPWTDFEAAYWRRGVFTTKFIGPAVTPCVRLSNVIALHRKRSWWPLNLTPNDPEVFLQVIDRFAPELTAETTPHPG